MIFRFDTGTNYLLPNLILKNLYFRLNMLKNNRGQSNSKFLRNYVEKTGIFFRCKFVTLFLFLIFNQLFIDLKLYNFLYI